jgi:ribosome-associated protein
LETGKKVIEAKKKLDLICEAAHDRKAEEIVVMEMGDKSSLGERFVVMSAPSTVRVKAIVEHIEDTLQEHGFRVYHKEGLQEAQWVLMDFGDILVHVFHHEVRKFYSLETLWGDAPRRNIFPS